MALTKVSTDGVKDDAITSGKIPANAVGASELADNAVDTNAIVDDAVNFNKIGHIDSGRLLGRVSGGLGQIETPNASQVRTLLNVADGANQTTINNNADNRIITGSGTANTLNGESSVVIDANGKLGVGNTNPADFDAYADRLVVGTTSGNNGMTIVAGSSNSSSIYFADGTSGGSQKNAGIVDYNHSTDKMRFATAASDAMVIDSNGQLLIGTTQSSAYGNRQLAVGDVSQSASYIEIRTSGTGTGHLLFSRTAGSSSGNYQGYIAYNQSSDHFSFHTGGGNQRARIDSDGLKFNADTAAANALDDYEEGTFTPAFTSTNGGLSVGYSLQLGKYIKVGRLVYVSFYIILNAVNANGSGNFMVTGLPFSHDSTNSHYGSLTVGYYAGTNNTIMQNGLVNQNDTTVHLFNGNVNTTVSNSNAAGVLTSSFQLLMSGTYMST